MEVRLPRLGEGADSGTVASIFVKEGDQVRRDQPILELESEKAVASIPSPADGTIARIHVKEGDEIKVGQLIVTLSGNGATIPQSVPELSAPDAIAPAEQEREGAIVVGDAAAAAEPETEEDQHPVPPPGFAPPASPSLRRLAAELGIDLGKVKGSERGGRIVIADLRRYIRQLQQRAAQSRLQPGPAARPEKIPAESIDFSKWGTVRREKLSTLRRTIASKMAEAWTSAPHVTQFDEADLSAIAGLQKAYANAYKKQGAHLTLTPVILKALVPTLRKHRMFNASLDEAAGEIVYKEYLHIGIAVDTEQGLIVPVIRDVDKKTMLELCLELQRLADRTRERKTTLDEMQGGSFTVSNQGGIGSGQFTPIINTPQVAILGVGRGVIKPVASGRRVVQRLMLPLSLSYDHRVADGADAARFMVDLVHALEQMKDKDVRP